MKFNEAMEALQKGDKVTRRSWVGSVYFQMGEDNNVLSFQPKSIVYTYNEDIMISDGWVVEGVEGEHKFYDIIDYIQQGKRAKLKDWKEAFIYYEQQAKYLVYSSMDVFPYSPDFESFIATDWMTI